MGRAAIEPAYKKGYVQGGASASFMEAGARKLRMVLDYLPCEACLHVPGEEQDLYCGLCRRLHRTVVQKSIERRVVLVEEVLPAVAAAEPLPEETLSEPAAVETEIAQAEPAEDEMYGVAEAAPAEAGAAAGPEEEEGGLDEFLTVVRSPERRGRRGEWTLAVEPEADIGGWEAFDLEQEEDLFGVAKPVEGGASGEEPFEEVSLDEEWKAAGEEFVLEPEPEAEPLGEPEPAREEEAFAEPEPEEILEFEPEPEGLEPEPEPPLGPQTEPLPAEEEPLVDFEPLPEETAEVEEGAPEPEQPPEPVELDLEMEAVEADLAEEGEACRIGDFTLFRRERAGVEPEFFFSNELQADAEPSPLPEGFAVKVNPTTGVPRLKQIQAGDNPVDEIGIGALYGERLRMAGIDTTSDLLTIDPFRLSEETGISERLLEKWKGLAELISAGLGKPHAELLVRAGLEGVQPLAETKAGEVLERVSAVASGLEVPLEEEITLRTVQGWIRKAKKFRRAQ